MAAVAGGLGSGARHPALLEEAAALPLAAILLDGGEVMPALPGVPLPSAGTPRQIVASVC